ncbi:hypothetical protein FEM48_Zijuj06G0210400 [Ziziphus jujuba var. spinosa]|uniref:Uncharacterized protein n=1 Tax=Ziziphus jujuba var. spinosa TaxID=714518 RepID=A0A978VBL6_ZIZJJ|nr:hypothetical protein FEM48_Zijuj06G0210400 [Ziziphus jujuba var. spinosa]
MVEDNYWIFFLESSIVVAEGEMHVEGIFQVIPVDFLNWRTERSLSWIELSRSRIAEGIQVEGIPVSILVPSQAILPLWHKDQKVTLHS